LHDRAANRDVAQSPEPGATACYWLGYTLHAVPKAALPLLCTKAAHHAPGPWSPHRTVQRTNLRADLT
jgi:hypothetical protein